MEAHAVRLAQKRVHPLTEGRRDLRDLKTITIDGPSTLDYDDALSISLEDDHLLSGDSYRRCGLFYRQRGYGRRRGICQSQFDLYAGSKESHVAPALSEGLCSLKAGEVRPAISTLIKITPQAQIISYEMTASLIQVTHQWTYGDIDAMLAGDVELSALHELAQAYRNQRLDNGALPIELPEISIGLTPGWDPLITRVERETTSRFLVAELMILANDLTARLLAERQLPAVFRAQAGPRERLFERDQGSFFQNWMQRKQLSRFSLSSAPEPHAGLGLPAYATSTSPIRKYTDLINQRQVRAALGLEAPYSKGDIDYIIAALQEPMAQVGRLQFRRQRYWILKYLEERIGKKEEALVLHRRREGYAIVLRNYMIETILSGAENITLKPEDLIQVTVQHVNARNDILTVFLG